MITYLLNLFKNQPLLPEHMHEPAKSGSDMSAAGEYARKAGFKKAGKQKLLKL